GERGLVSGTIYSHLAESIEAGERLDLRVFLAADEQKEIETVFAEVGFGSLGAVRERLGGRYDSGVLRMVRAAEQAENKYRPAAEPPARPPAWRKESGINRVFRGV